jgi:beta-N-acetylhexosaminidase
VLLPLRISAVVLTGPGLLSTLGLANNAPNSVELKPPPSAHQVLDQMTLRQKVGQLIMVGTPATSASPAALDTITRRHVGNVILTGRSYAGTTGPARVARAAQNRATWRATHGVRLLVATDQEGGLVQVLNGHGLSDMPTALQQGRWRPAALRSAAGRWARQLRASGVNMDLAPVEDTVPSPSAAADNPPIGYYHREFGFRPRVVSAHGRAFALGMLDKGVVPTLKHFPGLGRVHANTDTTAGVTDYVTTRHDRYLTPFARSIRAGAPVVMMSTAYYHRIDPHHPAAFSSRVIRGVLRGDLGFKRVVISDDLGDARQVARWSPAARAVKFVNAGGDIVLTVNPSTVPGMCHGLLSRATHSAAFRAKVNAAVRRVLELKRQHGLL